MRERTNNRAERLLIVGFLAILINSSYLAAYADPTLFYFGNVVLHLLLGAVLAVSFGVFIVKRLRTFSLPMLLSSVLLSMSAVMGFYLMIFGATRPYRWALYVHIGLAIAGSIPFLIIIGKAVRIYAGSNRRALSYVM